ncbi:MAG: phosphoribosylaminoimidazolesuccinocarboxamide synthase [Armatimonadota bacterium]|jgi:phosphoribosylaminoimidazole-succinocarboxamide synthase
MAEAVLQTDVPGALSKRSGKVRDIYDYGDHLLIVATDRISAFDVVMPTGITGKGKILAGLSRHWFDITRDIVPNHMVSMSPDDFPADAQSQRELLDGRTMLVRKADVVPVECVVRGYLAGSGWREYGESQTVCGHRLPDELLAGDKLAEPIFTPATKEASGHDINITREQAADIVGGELAAAIEEKSLALYSFGAEQAARRGLLLADTKFEFGLANGELLLIDEALTPDSSRYWDAEQWTPGEPPEAFDKQYLRDWLEELCEAGTWNKEAPGPELPPEVVDGVLRRYREAYERVTGQRAPA